MNSPWLVSHGIIYTCKQRYLSGLDRGGSSGDDSGYFLAARANANPLFVPDAWSQPSSPQDQSCPDSETMLAMESSREFCCL